MWLNIKPPGIVMSPFSWFNPFWRYQLCLTTVAPKKEVLDSL